VVPQAYEQAGLDPSSILQRTAHMRLIVFCVVLFAASASAAAQPWKEYDYPGYSFVVSFPAVPKIDTITYHTADGRSVAAHVYSVTQNDALLKITVADLLDTTITESALIDHAIQMASQKAEIKVDVPTVIRRIHGRQVSIVGADGSRSSIAVFYHKGRLYQIEGKVLLSRDDGTGHLDAGAGRAQVSEQETRSFPLADVSYILRFQESFDFTGGETNRPVTVYLSTYSDLSPMPQLFVKLKELVSEAAERSIPCLWRRLRSYISTAHNTSLDNVSPDYTDSLRIQPNTVSAYVNRADVYIKIGNIDHALADFNEAIRIDPNNAILYNNRGVAYQTKDDIDRAIADYSEAIRLAPKFALAYNNRGLAKRTKGDAAGAISDFATAKQIDPNVGIVWICHCGSD
jgi:hypothetical protein